MTRDVLRFPLIMKDASHGATGYILDLGDGSPCIISSTPINLTHDYLNNTNAIIDYILTYTVSNDEGCNDFYTDTIRVFPQVNSDFELVDRMIPPFVMLPLLDSEVLQQGIRIPTNGISGMDHPIRIHWFPIHTRNFGLNDTIFM